MHLICRASMLRGGRPWVVWDACHESGLCRSPIHVVLEDENVRDNLVWMVFPCRIQVLSGICRSGYLHLGLLLVLLQFREFIPQQLRFWSALWADVIAWVTSVYVHVVRSYMYMGLDNKYSNSVFSLTHNCPLHLCGFFVYNYIKQKALSHQEKMKR